jgi:hypothetical protein
VTKTVTFPIFSKNVDFQLSTILKRLCQPVEKTPKSCAKQVDAEKAEISFFYEKSLTYRRKTVTNRCQPLKQLKISDSKP